jgi:hypothetical protein
MPAYRIRPLPALLVSAATAGAVLAGAGTASAAPAQGLCTNGTWKNKVSDVTFQRGYDGTLAWNIKPASQARSVLGPEVTVTMPSADVNGTAINPPYQPHTGPSWHNFHGSINKFNYIGSSHTGTINTGDVLTFSLRIQGAKSNIAVEGSLRCQVPSPGGH